jgi:hypothetical protein
MLLMCIGISEVDLDKVQISKIQIQQFVYAGANLIYND